jgi:hypothetical protein
LKTGKLIVIEDDISKGTPGDTDSKVTTKRTLKDLPMNKTTKRKRMTPVVKGP